ncbi:hypothetical protein DPX16_23595 [Scomber scombrus]|uniref:Transposase n=1 Tax=Scomber scombrus TaxID=13677 RepID=A0AAV1QD48_SCOSC
MRRDATLRECCPTRPFNLLPGTEEEADDVTAGASCSTEHEEEEEGLPEHSQVQVEEITTNVESMVNQYFTVSILHLQCPIHMLHLVIKDAVNEHASVNCLLLKVGQLVTSVRKSCLYTEKPTNLEYAPRLLAQRH